MFKTPESYKKYNDVRLLFLRRKTVFRKQCSPHTCIIRRRFWRCVIPCRDHSSWRISPDPVPVELFPRIILHTRIQYSILYFTGDSLGPIDTFYTPIPCSLNNRCRKLKIYYNPHVSRTMFPRRRVDKFGRRIVVWAYNFEMTTIESSRILNCFFICLRKISQRCFLSFVRYPNKICFQMNFVGRFL